MVVEVVIQRALDYAESCGWAQGDQDQLAVRAVLEVRPDWSEIQALSAVDWVRSLSPGALHAA